VRDTPDFGAITSRAHLEVVAKDRALVPQLCDGVLPQMRHPGGGSGVAVKRGWHQHRAITPKRLGHPSFHLSFLNQPLFNCEQVRKRDRETE